MPPPPRSVAPNDPVRVVVGLLLVIPAAIALLVGYAWPTVRTVVMSFQDGGFGAGPTEFVGLDNYSDVVNRLTADAYRDAALLPLLPLVALLVVGPLLAYAAHRAGRAGRWTARLVLAVPMVCFAPAAIAVAWAVERGAGGAEARTALWLGTFGLAAGLGVTLYLAVLRGRTPGRSGWPAGLVVAAVAGIAAAAAAIQAVASPILLDGNAPVPLLYRVGLQLASSGRGAAHGTVLFGFLMLLGLAAAAVAILSGLRIAVEPARPDPPGGRLWAWAATALGLGLVLAVAGYGLWPWLSRLGELEATGGPLVVSGPSTASVLINTWLPPLVATVVGVGLAALAGFGIGGLRPLGRWSELLLLPFAPWLFVGIAPLLVAKYDAATDGVFGDRLDTFHGLVPPIWLVVPVLFLFTLLFRGLAERPRSPAESLLAWHGRMLTTALPMLALAGGATWLVQAQGLLWSSVISVSDSFTPGPLLAVRELVVSGAIEGSRLGLVLPVPVIVVFAVGLAVLQVLYLDRLTIRTGRSGTIHS